MFNEEQLKALLAGQGIKLENFRVSSGGSAYVHKGTVEIGSVVFPSGIPLALKEIKDPSANPQRIQQEELISRTIKHPNLVCGYGFIPTSSEDMILALRWADGSPLKEWAELNQAPWELAKSCMLDILSALESLHTAGYFHRDIKPSNIMITSEGRAVLMDVGVAECLDETMHTHTASFVGTLRYASPQFISGESYDEKDDIYAFGASFFHLLSGRTFMAEEGRKPLIPLAKRKPITLDTLRPGYPEEMKTLIDACLELDRNNRPTIEQAREALERLDQSEFIKAAKERYRNQKLESINLVTRLIDDTRNGAVRWTRCSSGAAIFREFAQDHLDCNDALRCTIKIPGGKRGVQIAIARVRIGDWDEENHRRIWSFSHWVYLCDTAGEVIKLLDDIIEGVGHQIFDLARESAHADEMKAFMAFADEIS